jgi:formylglycine-generating enzyme required for sulfatase activity
MANYGTYETIREVYSAPGLTVYSARKTGTSGEPEFAVKVFTPDFDTLMAVEAAGGSSSPIDQFELRGKSRIEVQKKAAGSCTHVAPVFESGVGNGEAWYVTRFYPRSVNRLIVGHVNLGKHGIHHVLTALAKGALGIKNAAGRSHGAIHPTNIQIGKAEKVRDVEVVLSDPAEGTAADADRLEKADLRAAGEVLYQLVRRRPMEEGAQWLILPLAATPEWTELFGRDTERWVKLCNRLLDPVSTPEPITLEKLVTELQALTPKPAISKPMLAAAAIALALVVAGIVVGYVRGAKGIVIVTVDPPEATLVAQGTGGPALQGRGRLEVKAPKKSRLTLTASYPGLSQTTTNVVVEGGETLEAKLSIPYGVVRIEAREAGRTGTAEGLEAIVLNPTTTNKTPYKFYVAQDGPAPSFTVSLDGFLQKDVKTFGRLGQTTNFVVSLTRKEPDEVAVALSLQSNPFGAEVVLDGQTNVLPYRQWLVSGKTYMAVASYLDWAPITNRFTASEKTNLIAFNFPFGTIRFECPNCPDGLAAAYVGNRKIGDTRKEVPWPAGDVEFILRAEGYDDASRRFSVRSGTNFVFSTNLNRTVGIVQLETQPAGAEIFDKAGKKVGETIDGKAVRLPLPPGPYSFTARDKNLGTVGPTNLVVVKAQTNQVVFRFDYSELVLASDPEGGEYRDPWQPASDWRPMEGMGRLILRPGENAIKVRHPKLNERDLKLDLGRWNSHTQLVQFPYASLVVTSLPMEATILIDGTQHKLPAGGWVEPLVRLEPTEFTLSYITNNQTLKGVVRFHPIQGGRYTNGFNFVRREWRNSIGMELVWIPRTQQGGGFWVGKYEVTREQFKAVTQKAPSLLLAGDARTNLPVDNVSIEQALLFCTNLSALDRSKSLLPELEGGSHDGAYGIPREDEWLYYSKASKLANAIASHGLATGQKRKGPEPVGSAPPDEFGLHDVKGNVWELCETKGEGVATLGGYFAGSALSLEGKAPFGRTAAAAPNEGNVNTGFRVVFRPSAPQ